jgi:hypothetical protein
VAREIVAGQARPLLVISASAVGNSRQEIDARTGRAQRAQENSPLREPWDLGGSGRSPGTGRKICSPAFFRPVPRLFPSLNRPTACAVGYYLTLLRSFAGTRPEARSDQPRQSLTVRSIPY